MATFVQATSSQNSNTISQTLVTSGNLLVFFYVATAGTPTTPSGTQSDWKAVYTSLGGTSWGYWTIATSSGTHSVTMGGTGSNQGCIIAEYTGTGATGVSGVAIQSLGVGQTAVSAGPQQIINTGALVTFLTLGQATAYASTSGSTNRTGIDTNHRNFLSDNLAATGSYTETGTLTGSMTFGGNAIVMTLGTPAGGSGGIGLSSVDSLNMLNHLVRNV